MEHSGCKYDTIRLFLQRTEDLICVKVEDVYAHLVEAKIGNQVSKMHLYYTGDDTGEPTVTFEKSRESIDTTIKAFDKVVAKIQNHEFSTEANNKKSCLNCDMRYYCQKVNKSK